MTKDRVFGTVGIAKIYGRFMFVVTRAPEEEQLLV